MGKIGIITCSTSGLDYLKGYEDIFIARTTIQMDGKEYFDGKNIHPKEFYERLGSLEEIPRTAQPSTSQLLEIYNEMKSQGYTGAIYISISDHLSGTYQAYAFQKLMWKTSPSIPSTRKPHRSSPDSWQRKQDAS